MTTPAIDAARPDEGSPALDAVMRFVPSVQPSASGYSRNTGRTVKESRSAQRVLDDPAAKEAPRRPALDQAADA